MPEIRRATPADAVCVVGLLRELGYDNELDDVADRLTALVASPDHEVLVATAPSPQVGVDGVIVLERRLALEKDEHARISALIVGAGRRRSGVGRALVDAGERWSAARGVSTVVVQSNVTRPESHPFYEGVGYHRTGTSHIYHKELRP